MVAVRMADVTFNIPTHLLGGDFITNDNIDLTPARNVS